MVDDKGSRSSRDDAPSPRRYRAMKRAAAEDVKEEFQLQCMFALVTMGELGLRAGELCHMTRDWVDLDRGVVQIPSKDDCECGYCRQQAKQQVERYGIRTFEKDLDRRWCPKMEASIRTIPYNWSDEIVEIYDRFFQQYDSWEWSRVSVNRRVDRIIEATPSIPEGEQVYPHALRAHAAMLHARQGMRAHHLQRLMGWSRVTGAMKYIRLVADDVEEELRRIHHGY